LSSRRATWSFCTRSVVRVKRMRHPFSMRAKPIAAASGSFRRRAGQQQQIGALEALHRLGLDWAEMRRCGANIAVANNKKGPRTAKYPEPYTTLSMPFGRGRRCGASIASQ
jgi:hypothetical protein